MGDPHDRAVRFVSARRLSASHPIGVVVARACALDRAEAVGGTRGDRARAAREGLAERDAVRMGAEVLELRHLVSEIATEDVIGGGAPP